MDATGARLPALFVSHGSPMVALDDDSYTRALRAFGAGLPAPRAIVVVSAHWQAPWPVRVTASRQPSLIYDFGGFPDALYRLAYPAPGAPTLFMKDDRRAGRGAPGPAPGAEHPVTRTTRGGRRWGLTQRAGCRAADASTGSGARRQDPHRAGPLANNPG